MTGVETVKEFEVITNAYTSEYGNYSGGVFNAITKSGTNQFHGSMFEFLRNSSLDAANFFDTAKPAFNRNQFGATVGGPILANKAFFFVGYEGLRQRRGVTATHRVPTVAARSGIIPGLAPITVHPGIAPWLTSKVFPFPSAGGRDFGDGTADFVRVETLPTNENFWTTRLDYAFEGNHTLFFRYLDSDGGNANPSLNVDVVDNNDTRSATLGYTRILSSSLLGSVSSSYTRGAMFTTLELHDGAELPLATWGDKVVAPGAVPALSLGSNISQPGGDATEPRAFDQKTFQQKASITWQKGRHALKFGGKYTYYMLAGTEPFNAAGMYTFRNLADALQGIPDGFAINTTEGGFPYHYRQWYTGAFIQDDIRLLSNLTLNAGLRYEFMSVVGEKDDRLSNVRDDWLRPGLTAADIFQIDDDHPLYQQPCSACFAPRVGVVWDPFGDGKSSVRSGFGMSYVPVTAGRMSVSEFSRSPLPIPASK